MKFKKQMTSLAFGIVALSAASANAAIVTSWTVGVSAVFDPSTIVDSEGDVGPASAIAVSLGDTRLRWGSSTGLGQSGLDIDPADVSSLVPTGVGEVLPPVANISVTHTNFPITGTTLDRVTLVSSLTLTPFDPVGPGLPSVSVDFVIDFLETPNDGTDGECADGGIPDEPDTVNENGCGDIFVIDQDSLNFPFPYDTDGPGGDDPVIYFISFVELTGGLNPLPPAACLSATGSSALCLGFVTAEEAVTPFQFGALITTEEVSINVPAPGVLGLMGLGLLGLAGARRRKA